MLWSPKHPLTRTRIWLCILVNLLATPGLGSIMARRYISGACQLVMALAGSVLVVVWIAVLFYQAFQMDSAEHASIHWLWQWGLILLAASWVWSLFTSILLLFQKREETNVPPKLG